MAFGQAAGPPASAKQLSYLASLLAEAGYDTFREARHPFGLTQRQAGGKFTKGEASALIDRLVNGVEHPDADAIDSDEDAQVGLGADPFADESARLDRRAAAASARAAKAEERLAAQREALVGGMPADLLVTELERRGWRCTPPPA